MSYVNRPRPRRVAPAPRRSLRPDRQPRFAWEANHQRRRPSSGKRSYISQHRFRFGGIELRREPYGRAGHFSRWFLTRIARAGKRLNITVAVLANGDPPPFRRAEFRATQEGLL